MKELILFYTRLSIVITLVACIDMLIFFLDPSIYNYLFGTMILALRLFTFYNSIILLMAGIYLLFKKTTLKIGVMSVVTIIIFFVMSSLVNYKLFTGNSN